MVNMFMDVVDKSIPFSFKNMRKYFNYKKKLKAFKRKISNGSPSFAVLWEFADFIKYSEIIFGFDKTGLYSSTEYKPGQNGFKISDSKRIIIVKLFSDTQTVAIDIDNVSTKKKNNYTFENNEWIKEPDEYDLFYINIIIQIINDNMLALLNRSINEKLIILYHHYQPHH